MSYGGLGEVDKVAMFHSYAPHKPQMFHQYQYAAPDPDPKRARVQDKQIGECSRWEGES